jgi:tRNA 2-thiouridine synthesizing protein A
MNKTILDVKGLSCPLPVLRAKRAMKTVPMDGILQVLATDPASLKDVPVFCEQAGYQLVSTQTENDELFIFEIKRTV